MINYNMILRILQCGITINRKKYAAIVHTKTENKYTAKDIIFIEAAQKTEKLEERATALLNTLPFFINAETRNIGSNFLLERLLKNYETDLSCKFSLKSCLHSSHLQNAFSKDQKDEIQRIYNSFKPDFISLKYWNNDFIRLLESQNSTYERIELIKKQIKTKRLMQCPDAPKKLQKVFLNIESTGTNETAEIIQISITQENEKLLFNELIKPSQDIEEGATYVHGLTNDMLKNYRTWKEIAPEIKKVLKNKIIYAYKADFDKRLIQQSSLINNVDFDVNDYNFMNAKEYTNPAYTTGKKQREEIAGKSQKDKDYYENSWRNYYEKY